MGTRRKTSHWHVCRGPALNSEECDAAQACRDYVGTPHQHALTVRLPRLRQLTAAGGFWLAGFACHHGPRRRWDHKE